MIVVLAKFRALPGKEGTVAEALREVAEAVERQEPGLLAYIMHRSPPSAEALPHPVPSGENQPALLPYMMSFAQQSSGAPLEFTVLEVYADDQAFLHHLATSHLMAFQAKMAGAVDPSSVRIEFLERFAGFIRPPS